jgi:hypothetical protein
MQKHVGNELPEMIMHRTEMMQGKKVFNRQKVFSNGDLSEPNQGIDDDEVFDDYGKHLKPARSDF